MRRQLFNIFLIVFLRSGLIAFELVINSTITEKQTEHLLKWLS